MRSSGDIGRMVHTKTQIVRQRPNSRVKAPEPKRLRKTNDSDGRHNDNDDDDGDDTDDNHDNGDSDKNDEDDTDK